LLRRRLELAEVGRLATLTPELRPHLVPCCFVLVGSTVYSAVDAKPKSSLALRRVENIGVHPQASLLVDYYDEDWSQLWWIRLDGRARIVHLQSERELAVERLRTKYPQYHETAISGPVIALEVDSWRSWP
jgi:PPOX class probable F420-dependent enzyme